MIFPYNPEPDIPKAMVYIDGTYTNINKSSNFHILRQFYCRYKSCHLVKPVLIVVLDGYILIIQGSDSRRHDAQILNNVFTQNIQDTMGWFQNGDIFVVDRGYRGSILVLEELGIQYKLLSFLQRFLQ